MSQLPASNLAPNTSHGGECRRPSNYLPCFWGDHFLSYDSIAAEETKDEEEHQRLKKEVTSMLKYAADHDGIQKKLDLIDAIQRLGVSQQFEEEIDKILKELKALDVEDDLNLVSLRFRLLRQHGINAPCCVFEKFKDKQGRFKDSIVSDVQGMLSLYEASHLRIAGEDILEEALAFTRHHLTENLANLGSITSELCKHAMEQPLWEGLNRVEARFSIRIYEHGTALDKTLIDFAKLDFNIQQRMHQRELSCITRWWIDGGFAEKFPFARDRIVELFFWTLGAFRRSEYVIPRRIITKLCALLTIMDDIYDIHGTIQELDLFTKSIQRWESDSMEGLPEYMRVCYQTMLDIFVEIEEFLASEENSYILRYTKESMKRQVKADFTEATWLHSRYVPSLEEYMHNGLDSFAFFPTATVGLALMPGAREETFEWLFSGPRMLKASERVGRILNDIAGHKEEQERGELASIVELYTNRYGSTEEEAVTQLQKWVSEAWKTMNEEWISPERPVPHWMLGMLMDFSRLTSFLYKNGDYFDLQFVSFIDVIKSVLINPVE